MEVRVAGPDGQLSRSTVEAGAKSTGRGANKTRPEAFQVAAQFIVDPNTHEVLVRIYDTRTGQTLRTIPPSRLVEFLLGEGGLDLRV